LTGLSETAYLAMAAIVETVLMALMASTIGTLLAIPISFMAAQNLMRDVRLPLAAIMGSLILALLGAAAGGWLGAQVLALSRLVSNPWLALGVLLLAGGAAAWLLRSLVLEDDEAAGGSPLARTVGVALVGALGLLALALLAQLGEAAGSWLTPRLGVLGFTANFILVLGNLVTLLFPALVGFVGLLLGGTWGGRLGQEAVLQLPDGTARGLTALLGVIGTALFVLVLGYGLIWLNVLGVRDLVPETAAGQLALLAWPAAVLGVLVGVLALRRAAKRPYPIGLTTYTVVRGTLNGLRSIEPLMMGFVFVVWVGLGPFAGILALTLHSIADLGKLFSEEVENIDEGPREAITATGASGVQTVVYAVVPQITPHYIAYIFYRWDINVRMSTVIGFVGGGGIGFVLQRFLNLTQYSRASVMVIAIALVVTILDTISSRIRTRII
ncbi:MAG: ABC transporter permease subunit, partial [Anaerolineales bacterium]|nr:ABC transporter permease subunit [Anaerolineales bacterium]